jgi:hypothetical protein
VNLIVMSSHPDGRSTAGFALLPAQDAARVRPSINGAASP